MSETSGGLAAFLRTHLDDFAETASYHPCRCGSDADDHHPQPDCPRFVLADIDAKRRIIDRHQNHNVAWLKKRWLPCLTLRLLALPYAGTPDYRDEWRP